MKSTLKSLAELAVRKKARVVEVTGGKHLQQRLMNLGIFPGKEITKLSRSAMRGPIAIRVSRSVIALAYSMACKIIVET